VLFVEYAAFFFPQVAAYKIPVCLVIIWSSAALNIRGIVPVGKNIYRFRRGCYYSIFNSLCNSLFHDGLIDLPPQSFKTDSFSATASPCSKHHYVEFIAGIYYYLCGGSG
jgi:amino acid transporter